MALKKITFKYTVGDWDVDGESPQATDWTDSPINMVHGISGDSVVVALKAFEIATDGTKQTMDLSGATALHCIVRQNYSPDAASTIFSYQETYNNGNLGSFEDTAQGQITWKIGIGPILYTITGVDTSNNYFYIDDDFSAQFKSDDIMTVSGSTGNDGTYTLASNATYDSGTNQTQIAVNESVTDATADGNIRHSALQNVSWNEGGYIDAFLECSRVTSDSDPQTILPAIPIRIHNQLDDMAVGVTSSSAPSYTTSSEVSDQIDKIRDKAFCRTAADSNIDLSSGTDPNPVGGVSLNDNDSVLLPDQSTGAENGIYVANSATDPSTWERRADFDSDENVVHGAHTYISEGTYTERCFTLTNSGTITLETTSLIFELIPTFRETLTIADDSAQSISPSANFGHIMIHDGTAEVGTACYDISTGATVEVADLNGNIEVTTGTLSGTTGNDTVVTISADRSNTQIDIENRLGGSRTFTITFIS